MNMNPWFRCARRILKKWIPPIAIDFVRTASRRLLRPKLAWEIAPTGSCPAENGGSDEGWEAREILETYKSRWPLYRAAISGPGPLGVSHESACDHREDPLSHNLVMTFGYVLGLALAGRNGLRLLDWGGGIGHYYLLAKTLFPDAAFDYHCKDVAALAAYGDSLFPEQHFYDSDVCLQQRYDLVMASTSLHYSPDWRATLTQLAAAANPFVYLANTPMVTTAPTFPFVQRHYNTEYVGWCLNRGEVEQVMRRAGFLLRREFVYGYQPMVAGAPEQLLYRGYLFEKGTTT